MATVTIVLEDGVDKDGVTAHVVGDFNVTGVIEGAPPTMAILFGTALQRMWRSRALAPLVPLIVGDMMGLQNPGRLAEKKLVRRKAA